MKIPRTEEADLRPPELDDRRRPAQGCRLPSPTGRDMIKGANENGYFGKHGAGDDLMSRYDREFCRHLWHPGSPQPGVEVLRMPRLEPQTNPRSLRHSTQGFGLSTSGSIP